MLSRPGGDALRAPADVDVGAADPIQHLGASSILSNICCFLSEESFWSGWNALRGAALCQVVSYRFASCRVAS